MAITNNFPEKRGLNTDDINEIMASGEIIQGNFVQSSNCYSTSEQIVGKWIDGKPIYQKTIYLDSLAYDSDWHNVAHNISNIQRIIEFYGVGTSGDENSYYLLNCYRPEVNQGIMLQITKTYIRYINTWQDDNNRTAYITIKYIKTTD